MIRIDTLPTTVLTSREHAVAAMKDGLTVQLTVGQILDLVIGAAPGALDTLDELAAALADDANFAASMTTALASKASIVQLQLATPVFGSVKLTKSGANLLLSRERGCKLTINGNPVLVPLAGITLAPTGLTPGTLYYIYAALVSGNMVLESSTTGWALDVNTGQAIKSGDATRALVGMVRPIAGPAFSDINKQRFVRSWYNEQGVQFFSNFTANRQTTSTVQVELNSEIRCEVIVWEGESLEALCSGTAQNNAANGRNQTMIGYDSTTVADASGTLSILANANDAAGFAVQTLKSSIAEGYHFITLLGSVNTNTGTWYGDSDGRRAVMKGSVRR